MLLATDLDGTLLGDGAALRRFAAWIKSRRQRITLVYATGRTADSIEDLVDEGVLVAPDYIAGMVGTELIDYSSGKSVGSWMTCKRAGWDAATVQKILASFSELALQPKEFQSSLKVSYYLRRANPLQLERMAAELAAAGIEAEVAYSCDEFLDFLPKDMSKGASVAYLAQYLGLSSHRVVACGDSGNDLSLFRHGFCGVVVANAWPDLYWACPEPTYRSLFRFADGVIDGVEYWTRRLTQPGLPGST